MALTKVSSIMITQATNIAELKTYGASMSDGDSLEILGYYAAGDGGGGTFYWDATSTTTANDGTIIQATGVTTGRWMRVFNQEISVEWFGARGDGDANFDDAPFIQAAIDAVASGGHVVLAARNYITKTRLSISKAMTLRGSTQFATSILCIGNAGLIINSVPYVQILNLEFASGVRHTTTPNTLIGIEVTGTTLLRPTHHVYRDVFLDGFKTGIKASWLWSSVFNNVTIDNGTIGIWATHLSVNNFITNCTLGGDAASGSKGIFLDGAISPTEGWMISDNLLDSFEIGIMGTAAAAIFIDNNIIDHCYSNGILLVDDGGTNFCGTWTIRGNYIAMQGPNGDAGIKSVNNIANSQNRGNIITNNQVITYTGSTCLRGITMFGTEVGRDIVSGNTVVNFTTYDIDTRGVDSVVTNNVCQSAITFNLLVYGDSVAHNNIGDLYFAEFAQYQTLGQNKVTWSYAIPTTGTWVQGDICYKSNLSAGGKIGWACVTGGTPGTWKTFGAITA